MSRNLEKLIKKITAWRQSATKLMRTIEFALALDAIPWDEVEVLDKQGEKTNKDIEKFNETIDNLIDLREFEDEVFESQDFSEIVFDFRTVKVLRGVSKLNKQLNKIETSRRIKVSRNDDNEGVEVDVHDPQKKLMIP